MSQFEELRPYPEIFQMDYTLTRLKEAGTPNPPFASVIMALSMNMLDPTKKTNFYDYVYYRLSQVGFTTTKSVIDGVILNFTHGIFTRFNGEYEIEENALLTVNYHGIDPFGHPVFCFKLMLDGKRYMTMEQKMPMKSERIVFGTNALESILGIDTKFFEHLGVYTMHRGNHRKEFNAANAASIINFYKCKQPFYYESKFNDVTWREFGDQTSGLKRFTWALLATYGKTYSYKDNDVEGLFKLLSDQLVATLIDKYPDLVAKTDMLQHPVNAIKLVFNAAPVEMRDEKFVRVELTTSFVLNGVESSVYQKHYCSV